jgi:multicomponent Na+:H+ antiporter subunit E
MIVWLTVLWLVLWRDLSVANLLSGVAIATVLALASDPRPALDHRVHPLAVVRFAAYFSWKLVEANVILAREVVTPQNRIHTGIIAVPLAGRSDLVVTVVANAVSLTPGTLTLEVRRTPEPVVYLHVLHLHDLDQTRADVETMARMVGEALEPRTAEGAAP